MSHLISFSDVTLVHLPSFIPFCSPHLHSLFSSTSLLFSPLLSSSPFLSFLPPLLCPVLRPVRYQRHPCSAWLPLKNRPWPNPALCHTGTSSKPVFRGRWSCLCHSDTCSSACPPRLRVQWQHGASPLPSDQTSPGRVCLCLWNQTLGGA